jgi:hypothetical protein
MALRPGNENRPFQRSVTHPLHSFTSRNVMEAPKGSISRSSIPQLPLPSIAPPMHELPRFNSVFWSGSHPRDLWLLPLGIGQPRGCKSEAVSIGRGSDCCPIREGTARQMGGTIHCLSARAKIGRKSQREDSAPWEKKDAIPQTFAVSRL